VGCCNHKNGLLILIDFIEETPGTDSIPPCFGMEVLKFLYIRSEMGMVTQLGVDEVVKLLGNFHLTGHSDATQVFLELFGFEYPVFNQQSVPCVPERRENLS
jgi:hypothetical protein